MKSDQRHYSLKDENGLAVVQAPASPPAPSFGLHNTAPPPAGKALVRSFLLMITLCSRNYYLHCTGGG